MTNLAEAGHKAPKVLIADDDPAIVKLLADRCAKMGFAVETAANGMQLLIKARRNHPDIMIIDVNMPELDRLTVCTRLLTPGSKPVEVLVVTGSSDPETEERCESLGLFYGRKGPEFWKNVEAALAEIFPALADQITGLSGRVLNEANEQILRREISGHPGAAKIFKKSFDTSELFGSLQKFCSFDKNYAHG